MKFTHVVCVQASGEDITKLERFALRSPAQLRGLVSKYPDVAWVRDLGVRLGLPDPLPPFVEAPPVPLAADGSGPDFGTLSARNLKLWLDAHGVSYVGLSEKHELVGLCREVAARQGASAATAPVSGSSAGIAPAPVFIEAGSHSMAAIIHASAQTQGCSVCSLDHGAAGAGTPLLTCGRCRAARYCSPACQRADWAAHKKLCKLIEQPQTEFAASGANPEASTSAIALSLSASLAREREANVKQKPSTEC